MAAGSQPGQRGHRAGTGPRHPACPHALPACRCGPPDPAGSSCAAEGLGLEAVSPTTGQARPEHLPPIRLSDSASRTPPRFTTRNAAELTPHPRASSRLSRHWSAVSCCGGQARTAFMSSESMSSWMRRLISSRICRTESRPLPAGSSSSKSRRACRGRWGQVSPQLIVTDQSTHPPRARVRPTDAGRRPLRVGLPERSRIRPSVNAVGRRPVPAVRCRASAVSREPHAPVQEPGARSRASS